MTTAAHDLIDYIDRSPTPFHAVAESARRLRDAGFTELNEGEAWQLSPGDARYVIRGMGSLIAFRVGTESPEDAGFHAVGAHTDSPNLRIKPVADVTTHGYRQLAVEPYGGLLLHTWLDRDLSLAGRVTYLDGDAVRSLLVDFDRALMRVPNLAIHLYRELREEGLKLNPQKHAVPMIGLEGAPPLRELLAAELPEVAPDRIVGYDLMAYDTQKSSLCGVRGEFINAPRLDNLASCHAGITALAATTGAAATQVVVLYDHEEVGSRSAQGAGGTLLSETLQRLVAARSDGDGQAHGRAIARSFLVSADMAHAIHPNYADRHEPGHQPRLGAGPVIKSNVNQSYASDAATIGQFTALCRDVDIEPQNFVTRSDLGCGSTIGPITAARLGIRTVDVGNPMLSMHSCREMAGAADVAPMIEVLKAFFRTPLALA